MTTHESQAMEASLVSDVAGLNVLAGRDRAVVRTGEELAAVAYPSLLRSLLALLI